MFAAPDPDNRSRLFWRLQALGWGGTLLLTLGMGGFIYSPASDGILLGVCRAGFGFVATSFALRPLLRIVRRRGQIFSVPHLAVLVGGCAILGLIDTAFTSGAAQVLRIDLDQPGVRPFLSASIFIRAALYGFWCTLYFGVHYGLDTQRDQLRLARAETAARSRELQMLRSQVNPHFLFNALNSILAESSNPASVRRLTLALADYLRFSLRQGGEKERLGVELEALENYLRVEKVRFEDNFEYRIETDDLAPMTPAPVALVQPMLENAIKYGLRSPVRPLRVVISAAVERDVLAVSVTNSGEWIEDETSTKTGLSNLRRRLDLLYPNAAALTIDARDGEVRAEVRLPAEREGVQP